MLLRIAFRKLFLKQITSSPIQLNCSRSFINTSLCGRFCTSTNEVAIKKSYGDDVKTIEQIQKMFKCTLDEAAAIYHRATPFDLKSFRTKFTFLLENGATLSVLIEYSHLLNMSSGK